MYTVHNYRTKKQLTEDVKAGKIVQVFQPGPFSDGLPYRKAGVVYLEGPHSPEPHKWYARVTLNEEGHVVKVHKS